MQENQNTEWKESWRDEYLKWICGFANAQGGRLYVGVRDDGTVCGVKDVKRLMDDLPNKIASTLGIVPEVNLQKRDGGDVIEIVVEPSNMPIAYHGAYHFRAGSTKQELKGPALQQFLLRKTGKTWDAISHPRATLEMISPEAVEYFQRTAIFNHRMTQKSYTTDIHKVLENLRLLDEDGYITNAALLAFGKDPSRFFPLCEFFIGRFGASQADLKFQDEIAGDLIRMTDRVIDVLSSKYLIRPIHYEGLVRVEPLELPEEALREAILNSIIHKDYTTVHIQMRVWQDRLELWNPGLMPEVLPIDKINEPHASYPRNPNLAKIFYMAGLIEHWGRGIEKITSQVADAKLKEPKIEETCGGVQITFFRDVSLQGGVPTENIQKGIQKSIRKGIQKTSQRIVDELNKNPYVTINDLSILLSLSEIAIKKNLSSLKKEGVIRRVEGRKHGHWEVCKL